MLHYLKGREFYSVMFKIALPIMIQNLVATSLNFVDTIMIGQLGSTELAAVGMANQVFFLMALFLFGLYSGSGIFISQFWGKKDIKNIRRVLGIAVISGILASSLFTLSATVFPRQILRFFMKDGEAVRLSMDYLSIVAFSYTATAVSFGYGFLSRNVGQAKLPMYVSIISLGTNTLLNYMLIFGNFSFPALGVKGAAIATVVSRLLEMSLLLFFIYTKKYVLAARLKEMLDVTMSYVKDFYKTSGTVILNEFTWALGIVIYFAIYARMGEDSFAAVQMVQPIQNISMVLFFGLANACCVMLGNKIGADHEEDAFLYAKKFAVLGLVLALVIGVILFTNASRLVAGYKVDPALKETAARILVVFASYLTVRIFNLINIVGILRSGGDTKFTLFLDSGVVWFIGVPLAVLGGLVWRLPIHLVVALVSLEEIFKAIIGLNRLLSKKWLHNIINNMGVCEAIVDVYISPDLAD
ncbi:MAG: MATE family efflux transporter [Dethiobacter sp.]|jgi:putative MATE family efflux protein|nr:MATE family efflux transporter [Dethiobacter sp.]